MKRLIVICALIASVASAHVVKCPKASAIRAVGFGGNYIKDADGKYYFGRSAQAYGTPQMWTFALGGISAHSKVTAYLKAKKALSTLHFASGPVAGPASKSVCVYDNNYGYPSGAVSPPVNTLYSLHVD